MLLLESWLKEVGKDKIQIFQDSFAQIFNLSLCLLSVDNKTITVWSNSSLFCHYTMQNNHERCIQERTNLIEQTLRYKKTQVYTCYMGLKSFCCPIFHGGKIISFFYGGAIKCDDLNKGYKSEFNEYIPIISELQFSHIVDLLENTINLISIKDKEKGTEVKSGLPKGSCFLSKKLTRRENEVVDLICEGYTNKEISEKLIISEKTVKTHVSNILKKLQMKDRMQIIVFCQQHVNI